MVHEDLGRKIYCNGEWICIQQCSTTNFRAQFVQTLDYLSKGQQTFRKRPVPIDDRNDEAKGWFRSEGAEIT